MRPKFITIILFITLGFLLVLLCAGTPLSQRVAVSRAAAAQRENPTPENRQAVKLAQDKIRHRQYVIFSLAVLNAVVIIVYGALQQRKSATPQQLDEIMRLLSSDCTLVSLKRWPVNCNWTAVLDFKGRKFQLECDRGYVEVFDIEDGRREQIWPPEDQRISISPVQICELLRKASA